MWRGPDLAVIGLNLAVMVWIGVYCARKSKSSDAYFLAGRNMAGWVVGMSMMATIVSSMTFLATPGFTYSENWRYMPANFTYLLAAIPGLLLFMPLFRRGGFRSAYEYLERRFGTWARLYAGGAFILFQMFRLGVILYAVCLPIKAMTGFSLPWVIVIFGVLVAAYTIAGGLEAVIWTDLIQGFRLDPGRTHLPAHHLRDGAGRLRPGDGSGAGRRQALGGQHRLELFRKDRLGDGAHAPVPLYPVHVRQPDDHSALPGHEEHRRGSQGESF